VKPDKYISGEQYYKKDESSIVFWAGADSNIDKSIQEAPF
jgi:hypothetical protein